jgi:hypothetical protein
MLTIFSVLVKAVPGAVGMQPWPGSQALVVKKGEVGVKHNTTGMAIRRLGKNLTISCRILEYTPPARRGCAFS